MKCEIAVCPRQGVHNLYSAGLGRWASLCKTHERRDAKLNIATGCGIGEKEAYKLDCQFLKDPSLPLPWLERGK